jgi:hypothetical protein
MDNQQSFSTLEDEGKARRASEISVTRPQMMSAAKWYSTERSKRTERRGSNSSSPSQNRSEKNRMEIFHNPLNSIENPCR